MKPLTADNVGAVLQAEANWCECDKTGGSMALFTSEKPKKGKGKGSKGKDSQSSPKLTDECRYCKHLGHWADKCPQQEEDRRTKSKPSATSGSANAAIANTAEPTSREVGHVYTTTDSHGHTGTILDTGATGHMCQRPATSSTGVAVRLSLRRRSRGEGTRIYRATTMSLYLRYRSWSGIDQVKDGGTRRL